MSKNQSCPEGQNSREWLRYRYGAVGDIQFNIIYIMRTNMNSGTIRPFMAVIIVVIVLLYTVHITVEMSCGLLRVFCSFFCFPV